VVPGMGYGRGAKAPKMSVSLPPIVKLTGSTNTVLLG